MILVSPLNVFNDIMVLASLPLLSAPLPLHPSQKGAKYMLLHGRLFTKWIPCRVWVIIDTLSLQKATKWGLEGGPL